MARYNKAIAATVAAVAAVLLVFNVEMSDEVQATIISVATGLATLLAPANAE